jgi:hypothetical protein
MANSGLLSMQSVDFERARISWTTKTGIDGTWRITAMARREGSFNFIVLAAGVMAGHIFGGERLPWDPPYSFQLIATPERHVIVREDEVLGNRDTEAANEAAFSSFDIHAPQRAATSIEVAALSKTVAHLWPISVRLSARNERGELWNLEFPANHISTRIANEPSFQIESGPIIVPHDLIKIPEASSMIGCSLAYVFLNKTDQVDLLAWGPSRWRNNSHRSFVQFARVSKIETDICGACQS